jgi:hypothetical protein
MLQKNEKERSGGVMKYQVKDETVDLKVGDQIYGNLRLWYGMSPSWYRYTIKSIEVKERFGQPNVLLVVDIDACDNYGDERKIDRNVKRWYNQLY